MKFEILIGGIILFVIGSLGIVYTTFLSNPVINAMALIAIGIIGMLRSFIKNNRIFRILVALIVFLLILIWVIFFTFSFSSATIESVTSY